MHFSTKKYPVISWYNNVHDLMGINALIFWMPVKIDTVLICIHIVIPKCLKKVFFVFLFEYLVNAIIALLWGIIAWRFFAVSQTNTHIYSSLSWVSYYSFKLLKMNALKVDLWPCFFISLSDSTLANESEKNSFGYDSHWTEIDNQFSDLIFGSVCMCMLDNFCCHIGARTPNSSIIFGWVKL